MTPESKLAEKLWNDLRFEVYEVHYPATEVTQICSRWWTRYSGGAASPATNPEIALWNLCLELSAENERLQPRICVTPANELNMGIVYEAEKEKKA